MRSQSTQRSFFWSVIESRKGVSMRSDFSADKRASVLFLLAVCVCFGVVSAARADDGTLVVVSGDQSWIDAKMLSADRFGDKFSEDRSLRAQCEEVYAHHYHEIY